MPLHILVAPEVCGPEAGRSNVPHVVDALYPSLDVDLGRRRRRADVGLARQPDTGHVTRKERARVRLQVGEVMVGVARSVMDDEDASRGLRLFPILQYNYPVFGHGIRLAPELFHSLAVDAGRALYELRGIDQMRISNLVHVEGRVRQQFGEVS